MNDGTPHETEDASADRASSDLKDASDFIASVVAELKHELAASRNALHQAREEQAELRTQLAKATPAGSSSSSSDLQKETEELRVQLKDVEAMAERATAAKAVAELRLQLGAVNARGDDQKKLTQMEDRLKEAEKREAQASSEEQTAMKKMEQAEQRGEEKNVALGQLSTKLAEAQQQNALLQARLDQLEVRLEERLEQQEVRSKEREEAIKLELLEDGRTQSAQIFRSELAAQEVRNDELSFELNEARRVMSAAPWERDMEEQRLQLNRVKDELRMALNRIQEFERQEGPSGTSWDGAFNDKADQAAGAPYKPGSTLIRKAKAKVSLRNAAHANRARDPPNFLVADPHDAHREAGDQPQMHRRMSGDPHAHRRMAGDPDSPSHVMRVLQGEVNWEAPESRRSPEFRGPEPVSNASVAGPGHSPTNFASTMARNRALQASRSPAQPLTRGQRVGQGMTRTRGSAVLQFERRLAAQEALGLNGSNVNLQGGQGLPTNNDRGRQERRGEPRPYRGGWRQGRDGY
eukprot:gnl/MRDRNA2_/MRDRNA2_90848_c0_seq1.p1 gnl/MRDRNA2_/MRDRNA2_90848_c0~~gnl/MRDRNA2_/MRDRNA2_90848_c0_seq1.p1  ORF type:complete len:522 (-),score=129.18 gnl/MRDRNA2_/MRDRNA2_90848_c0_seq1:139-1704(-)